MVESASPCAASFGRWAKEMPGVTLRPGFSCLFMFKTYVVALVHNSNETSCFVPMALLWQLLYCGPFVRLVFRALMRVYSRAVGKAEVCELSQ